MKIKKIATSIGVLGKILNSKSSSKQDTYSCDYINKLNTYSDEEQVIGTWRDGKPLYRKVIEYMQTNTIGKENDITNITIPHNINNFKQIVNCSVVSSLGNILPILNDTNSVTQSSNISFIDENGIKLRIINVTLAARIWYITLEYTKTTD